MRWFAALVVLGCGDGSQHDPTEDAGPSDGGGFEPAPAEPPAPPVFTPCPKGWREVADPDDPELVTCDPWPDGGPRDCAAVDEAHFPGEPGCRRIGTGCPTGDWAEDIPKGSTVVYVKAGAAAGDGTRDLPYGTIREAIETAPDGAVVAISKGTFDEVLSVSSPLTLWGACVAETRIASTVPSETLATVTLTRTGGATLRNLQVGGARRGIVVYSTSDPIVLDSVLVHAATDHGVAAFTNGELVARDLVIRETLARPRDDGFGRGLGVQDGAHAELTRAVIEGNLELGIFANSGGELVATDVAIRGTRGRSDGTLGHGLEVDGARAELTRVAIEGNRQTGIFAWNATELVATDLTVRDTQARSDGTLGRGLELSYGARAELTRATFERNRDLGIFVTNPDTELVAMEIAVRGTQAGGDGASGRGLELSYGAHAELTRVAFEGNREVGVFVVNPDTELVAADVRVRGTESAERDGTGGRGLEVSYGARAELTRAAFEGNRDLGVFVVNPGTELVATDLVVAGTLERACAATGCEPFGTGIVTLDGASVVATRFRIADNVLCGVQIAGLDAGIDLHEGEVSRNVIGVNVQTSGFDVARLQDRVLYIDNVTDLDTALLPVPEAAGGAER